MEELKLLKDFVKRWSSSIKPEVEAQPFYRMLKRLVGDRMRPDEKLLAELEKSVAGQDAILMETWRGWLLMLEGDRDAAWKKLKRAQASARKSAEANAMVGMAALYEGNRALALKAFEAAAKAEPAMKIFRDTVSQFGVRRAPVLPFLDRTNPINRWLGKFRR